MVLLMLGVLLVIRRIINHVDVVCGRGRRARHRGPRSVVLGLDEQGLLGAAAIIAEIEFIILIVAYFVVLGCRGRRSRRGPLDGAEQGRVGDTYTGPGPGTSRRKQIAAAVCAVQITAHARSALAVTEVVHHVRHPVLDDVHFLTLHASASAVPGPLTLAGTLLLLLVQLLLMPLLMLIYEIIVMTARRRRVDVFPVELVLGKDGDATRWGDRGGGGGGLICDGTADQGGGRVRTVIVVRRGAVGAEVVFERGAAGDLGVVGHVERGESVEENR